MIFYLFFFYLLGELMAVTNSTKDSTTYNNDMSTSIICSYYGKLSNVDPRYDNVDSKDIPKECHFILFELFSINQSSMIDVDQELLDELIALNKSIILLLSRDESYDGWNKILGSNGNKSDAKVLCDFAKNNSIKGYTIYSIAPSCNDAFNPNVGKFIIPYLKQLKELCPSNFIIGLGISVVPEILYNTEIYNFEELNDIVTFYDINIDELNNCKPKLYNGVVPITISAPGVNYLYGLEEVVLNLKKTKICLKKLVITIPVFIKMTNGGNPPYTTMCKGQYDFDNSSMCVQTSKNFFDKGMFLQNISAGLEIYGLDSDDSGNFCKCHSAFNGFYNLYAGYTNGTLKECSRFDVQSTVYPLK